MFRVPLIVAMWTFYIMIYWKDRELMAKSRLVTDETQINEDAFIDYNESEEASQEDNDKISQEANTNKVNESKKNDN